MEEKCLEKSNVIEPPLSPKLSFSKASDTDTSDNINCQSNIILSTSDKTTTTTSGGRSSLHDILLNLPSTSRSSMSLLQEEDFGNSQNDFAEVLDEDTTTSGVLETFEISSSNSLPTCSDTAADVAVVDDSSSADAVKMMKVINDNVPSLMSTRNHNLKNNNHNNNNNNKFFNESEIFVINDDDDDEDIDDEDDDDVAVVVTDGIESETPGLTNQLNGVITGNGGQTIFLETPVVEEQQHHHHHHHHLQSSLMSMVAAATATAVVSGAGETGVPKRLSDEFMLHVDDMDDNNCGVLIEIDNSNDVDNEQDDDDASDDDDDDDDDIVDGDGDGVHEDAEEREEESRVSMTDKKHKITNADITAPVSDAGVGDTIKMAAYAVTAYQMAGVAPINDAAIASRIKSEHCGSSAEGNAERMSFRLKNMSINNSTSQDCARTNGGINSSLDELPSGSNGLITAPTMADIESMDLIERRDFETEQRLTGGIILKSSSLINKNLLNLRLVKSTQQNQVQNTLQHSHQQQPPQAQQQLFKTQEDSSHNKMGRAYSSDSKCTYNEPHTTPTSSRTFNSRLTKSTAKLNMNSTLSQYNSDSERLQQQNVSASNTSVTSSSSVIVEPATTTATSNSNSIFSNISNSAVSERAFLSVNSNCQQQQQQQQQKQQQEPNHDQLDSGCSRTTAIFSVSGSSNANAQHSNDDSEPSTSARCQYTPQAKVAVAAAAAATAAANNIRLMQHASAQTNNHYVSSRVALARENSQNAASAGSSIVIGSPNTGVSHHLSLAAPAGSLRSRRRAEAAARNANSDSNLIAAFKVVAEAAASAVSSSDSVEIIEDDAWVDCEENTSSDLEEVCTCPHRSDSESSHSSNSSLNEDDFETSNANTTALYRDGLDLPGYLPTVEEAAPFTTDSVSCNMGIIAATAVVAAAAALPPFATSQSVTTGGGGGGGIQSQQRKRKYDGRILENDSYNGGIGGNVSFGIGKTLTTCNDGNSACGSLTNLGSNSSSTSSSTDPNRSKRMAFDFTSTPRTTTYSGNCSIALIHTTPTTSQLAISPFGSPLGRRTPRSVIPTRENPPPELQNWLAQFQRWTHAERLIAVDRLIEHCEPTQVRHMMKVIEPQFQRDFISLLPRELALQVLAYLDPKDLLRAAQTCRSWRYLCDDNLLWREKCRKAQIVTEEMSDKPKRGRAGKMPPIASPWKAAYMRQHIIEMNWRSRPIRDPKVLKGHDEHVITCLQFAGNRIVSGSDDNTLKVWSAVTGRCLRTLVGHTGGVWSSQMSGNIIISGSTDRTLKVWDMETGMCIHTLMGHTSTVRCMHLHGNKVVSGSRDATLRVWDIEQGQCLHVLVGHLAAVRCVQYDGKLIVSGAYDYMVKIWHPERQECLHTLQGHTNRVYSLQFDGVHVVSGSLDTSIRVWDVETGNCKHTLMGHQSLTSGMELRQNILVSGNADSTVKVWDITTGQCLQTLSGPNKHQSAVTCLQFNSRFVVTSSDDGTVKLWDVKTGEFIRNLVSLDSGGSGGVVWRIRANDTKLICAVGSRNGTEETKLLVLDFDVEGACVKCS